MGSLKQRYSESEKMKIHPTKGIDTKMNHKTIIGIDLGTATTKTAIFRNGKAEMIPNFDGNLVTPSVIGIDESGILLSERKPRPSFSWPRTGLSLR